MTSQGYIHTIQPQRHQSEKLMLVIGMPPKPYEKMCMYVYPHF